MLTNRFAHPATAPFAHAPPPPHSSSLQPGGDASEADVLSSLAALYESGGGDLQPDSRLTRQFELLARSTRRRTSCELHEDSDGSTSGDEGSGGVRIREASAQSEAILV